MSFTARITTVLAAMTAALMLGACTGSIPEGQSYREDKAAVTEIDGCKTRKYYIKTTYNDASGEPVFMARCIGEDTTTITQRNTAKGTPPARVMIIRENGVDKIFEESLK